MRQRGSSSAQCPGSMGQLFTIWAISCRRVHTSLRKYLFPPQSSSAFAFEYAYHSFTLPIEVLPTCGHKVPLYSFLSCPMSDALHKASVCLEANIFNYSLLSDCILVGTPLRHMNLLHAIKKLSVEYESMNAPWNADEPVDSKMNPYPYQVRLLLTVPRHSTGPNRSAATELEFGAGTGSMVWQRAHPWPQPPSPLQSAFSTFSPNSFCYLSASNYPNFSVPSVKSPHATCMTDLVGFPNVQPGRRVTFVQHGKKCNLRLWKSGYSLVTPLQ